MTNYDFNILQFNEFESLCRDLLQKKNNIFIESFADGRDDGIDLRYATTNDKTSIVQVKRHKTFNELFNALKSEIQKVRKLNPTKYYIATSVDLTPKNKDKIKSLFKPYIKSTSDILGRKDLNNLIGLYNDIEKKYYKLWLASTNVLNDILNKSVINWSQFSLDSIKEQITKYVTNDSFARAIKILEKNKYIIISGIPGIGKTTLAQMLVYDFLARGYEEYINIQTNLDEAAKMFQKGKKQVFFYDDFLGSNVFEPGEKNFDKKLIEFIGGIKRDRDKMFIMTTREYILSEAETQYESLNNQNLDIIKCTLDLSDYDKFIRAQILYNHLAAANIPNKYIGALLDENNYLKIIEHHNFNPRVIETYIDNGKYLSFEPKEFVQNFISFFDKPVSVWGHSFNILNDEAKYALFILATTGAHVFLDDWFKAFKNFCMGTKKNIGLNVDEIKWRSILKILQGTYIKIDKLKGNYIVDFHDPSIRDFLTDYLSGSP